MTEVRFPLNSDARGDLVAIEGADVGFAIKRVFTVTGAVGGSTRGGHFAECHELIVLVSGRAQLRVRRSQQVTTHDLSQPGEGVHIGPDDFIDYDLAGRDSVVMVLCDAPYEERA